MFHHFLRDLFIALAFLQFMYNNGFGNTVGRFKIDLYSQDGYGGWMGDCGGWVGSICDKPDIGCKDTSE